MIVNIRRVVWDTDNQNLLERLHSFPQEMQHELLHGDDIYKWGDDKESIAEEIHEYLADNWCKAKGFAFCVLCLDKTDWLDLDAYETLQMGI
jgi:hypothetical protein